MIVVWASLLRTQLDTIFLTFAGEILIPVVTAFESESIYVNFEQRYQKTLKTFPSVGESRELKKIIKALYSETVNFKSNKSATFIEEVINNPEKFKTIQNIFLTQDLLNSKYLKNNNILSTYPLKSSFEDFYRSNKFTKNSKVMSECSKETRKTFKNFF